MKINLERIKEYELKYKHNDIARNTLRDILTKVVQSSNLDTISFSIAYKTLVDLKIIEE